MFKKLTWGHGVAIALASFIAFILFMIFVFSNGMQNSELISDNYYHDELTYQDVINAKNNADKLSEKPIYKQTSEGIAIIFPENNAPENSKVNIELFRTEDSNLDVKKELTLNEKNEIIIPATVINKGSYTLKVKWNKNKTPYQIDYDVQWK